MLRGPTLLLALAALLCASSARAQGVPSRVRLLHPGCADVMDWAALEAALQVELRTMGSDLAGASAADARVILDVPCDGEAARVHATLVHAASGRSASEDVPLGATDRVRVLALGLSELVRARWPQIVQTPPPPPPAPSVDVEALRADLMAEVREQVSARVDGAVESALPPTDPPPPPPGTFVDLALAVSGYPAASNATGELRVGVSLPVAELRLGLEAVGAGGWAADPLGDVALGGIGGALSLRLAHAEPSFVLELGPRFEAGWIRAQGLPRVGASGAALDAAHLALGLEARARVRLGGVTWLLFGGELGAAVLGVDARADDRRVTAQVGPRLGLFAGLAFAP